MALPPTKAFRALISRSIHKQTHKTTTERLLILRRSQQLLKYALNQRTDCNIINKMPRSAMSVGMDVQHDPYSHLLSQQEKQAARCIPFRMAFNGLAAGMAALYYMSRQQELGRVKALRITFDLALNVVARVLLTTVVADQVSRRIFVNYLALKKHQMADYEVRKVMRTWSLAKPHQKPHERPNSYFWC